MNIKFDALLGKIREDDFSSSTLSLYILKTGNTSPIDLGINNFTVDTNSLFVDSVLHRVGIGTLTPAAKLEVNGAAIIGSSSVGGTNISLNAGGPALTKNISIYYQSGTPSSSTTDYVVIQGAYLGSYYTNLALNPSGSNVGIGTTTPTATAHIFSNQANCLVVERSVASANATIQYKSGATSLFAGLSNTGNFGIGLAADLSTAIFAVTQTGRVGAGIIVPTARLHVYSSTPEDSLIVRANNASFWKVDQYGTFTYSGGGLSFGYDPNVLTNTHSSNGATYITSGLGSASAFDIIIKPSGTGNVGIGDSNPQAKLSILGNLNFADAPGNSRTDIGFYVGTGLRILNKDNTALTLGTSNSERVRIDPTGNVGIGTATPTAILHIKAGTSSAAPLKLTPGTNLTTVQDGAFEYNGTNLFFTVGGTRKTVTLV